MPTEKQLNLLKKYDWNFEFYMTDNTFLIIHKDGSSIKNSKETLIYLLEQLEEEELEEQPKERETMEDVLNFFDYEIVCESPLEITHTKNKDVFITGYAAILLVENLRSKKFIKELK